MFVFWNHDRVRREEALLPACSPAVLYGCGLFETILFFRGRAILLEEHLSRLVRGAEALDFDLPPPDRARIEWQAAELSKHNRVSDGVLRLTLFQDNGSIQVLLTLDPPRANMLKPSLQLTVASDRAPMLFRQTKNNNYLAHLYALRGLEGSRFDDVLIVGDDGCVCETATANLFLIEDNLLRTPPLTSGILPGVQRDWVLETAGLAGIPVDDSPIPRGALGREKTLFLTNSLIGVKPVTGVDDIALRPDHPILDRLTGAWEAFLSRGPAGEKSLS